MAEVSGVQHLRRRSVATQLNLFVGSSGELMADMTNMRTSLSDGVTAGGWPSAHATASINVLPGQTRSVLNTDVVLLGITNVGSGSIIFNLPSAKSFPFGQKLIIADSGNNIANVIGVNSATSTERIIGNSGGTIVASTTVTYSSAGTAFVFTAVSTNATWIFWQG